MDFIQALDSREVQRFLGIDLVLREVRALIDYAADTGASLYRMEREMATAREQLDNLSGKVDDLVNDVRAARAALEADRENLSEDGQAALDTLAAKIDAFDAEVGDADNSDAPTTVEPGTEEPGTDEPAAGGDTGEGDGTRVV